MRIGQVTGSVSRDGAGVFQVVCSLSKALRQAGVAEVQVFGLRDAYTGHDQSTWGGLPVTTSASHGPAAFGYSRELARRLLAARLDLVHLHGIWMHASVACRRWARLHQAPCVVSPHGMLDPWALGHSAWKKRLAGTLFERRNLDHAACLHALTSQEADSMRAYGLRNPIAVIPSGLDLPEEGSAAPPPWDAQLLQGSKVLLYLGRLHPKKGLLNLIEAWRRLAAGYPHHLRHWRLVIAGWSQQDHEQQLRRSCESAGVASSVLFAGPQYGSAKQSSYGRAEATVLPSLSEGLPLSVLESWAHRKPAIVTPHCNLPQGVAAGAALLAQAEPGSLLQALLELFEMSDADRAAAGARGRRLVEAGFAWSEIARQMLAVYTWLLGAAARPDCVLPGSSALH